MIYIYIFKQVDRKLVIQQHWVNLFIVGVTTLFLLNRELKKGIVYAPKKWVANAIQRMDSRGTEESLLVGSMHICW